VIRVVRRLHARSQLSVPAHRAGPQWWRQDVCCSGVGTAVSDWDLDAAGKGTVSRCRPLWAVWWCGGEGGCAVVVGAASGVTEQGVGGQQLP
jgi:hypothetical protein